MKVFFDNCTSPVLADILHAYLKPRGGAAFHVRDMIEYGLNADSVDIDWMRVLSKDNVEWVVLTADDRIHRNRAERSAWKQAGLKGFVFARGFQKTPLNEVASTMLFRWPQMEDFIKLAARGSMFELPLKRSSGFKPLGS